MTRTLCRAGCRMGCYRHLRGEQKGGVVMVLYLRTLRDNIISYCNLADLVVSMVPEESDWRSFLAEEQAICRANLEVIDDLLEGGIETLEVPEIERQERA